MVDRIGQEREREILRYVTTGQWRAVRCEGCRSPYKCCNRNRHVCFGRVQGWRSASTPTLHNACAARRGRGESGGYVCVCVRGLEYSGGKEAL